MTALVSSESAARDAATMGWVAVRATASQATATRVAAGSAAGALEVGAGALAELKAAAAVAAVRIVAERAKVVKAAQVVPLARETAAEAAGSHNEGVSGKCQQRESFDHWTSSIQPNR